MKPSFILFDLILGSLGVRVSFYNRKTNLPQIGAPVPICLFTLNRVFYLSLFFVSSFAYCLTPFIFAWHLLLIL
jgi:hypothetical protein